MRLIILPVLVLLPCFSFSQTNPAQPTQKIPGKDPVMVMDKLAPGKSKHYNWDNGTIKMAVWNDDNSCNKINISFNNKPTLQHQCVGRNKRSFSLKLKPKANFIVLTTDMRNTTDSSFATITLTGQATSYTVKATCRKKVNDTIFIKYK